MNRNDVVARIEELLGADGSRELADAILRSGRVGAWSGALEVIDGMEGAEWGAVIDDAQALLDSEAPQARVRADAEATARSDAAEMRDTELATWDGSFVDADLSQRPEVVEAFGERLAHGVWAPAYEAELLRLLRERTERIAASVEG
jgi:hypothetical protein